MGLQAWAFICGEVLEDGTLQLFVNGSRVAFCRTDCTDQANGAPAARVPARTARVRQQLRHCLTSTLFCDLFVTNFTLLQRHTTFHTPCNTLCCVPMLTPALTHALLSAHADWMLIGACMQTD